MEVMHRKLRNRRLLITPSVAVVVLALLLASPARADYKESYREGVKAEKSGNWADVIKSMTAAIRESGKESSSQVLIYGNWYEPYVPHFYLALAYANSGNCAAALQSLAMSESQGVIAKTKQGRQISKVKADCPDSGGSTPPPPPPPPTPLPVTPPPPVAPPPPATPRVDPALAGATERASNEISSAQKARDAVAQLKSDRDVARILAENPPLQRQESAASESLRSAVTRANQGQKAADTASVRAAGDLAVQATRQFDALRADLQRRKDDAVALAKGAEEEEQARLSAVAQLEQERETIRQLATQARAVLQQITSQGPQADVVRTGLESAITQAAAAETNTSLPELTAIKTNVANQIATAEIALASIVPQKAGEPPPSLTAAANAFLGGRYDDVITLLDKQKYGDAKEIAHAQLFIAAARFALYYDGGQKDAALLSKAAEDVKTCKIADPAMNPQTRYFSPRFVAFFKSKG